MGPSAGGVVSDKRNWSLYKADGTQSRRWWVIALFAAWAFYAGASSFADRLLTTVDGTIILSRTTPGVRPVTYYTFLAPDGQQMHLVAGPTDGSLPRKMPVGTVIQKRKFELAYARNGQRVNDFPLGFQVLWIAVSLISGCVAFVWWKSERPE